MSKFKQFLLSTQVIRLTRYDFVCRGCESVQCPSHVVSEFRGRRGYFVGPLTASNMRGHSMPRLADMAYPLGNLWAAISSRQRTLCKYFQQPLLAMLRFLLILC